MRLGFLTLIVAFLGYSCGDTSITPIDYYIQIHDNSSKVWLVDQQLEGEKDYTPLQFQYKEIMVFHQSKNVYVYRLLDLGKKKGKKMNFWLDASQNELSIMDGKTNLLFTIKQLTRKKMVLETKSKTKKQTLILIPFPEY